MIHLIYIYFIVNAFLAGYEYRWDKHIPVAMVMFLIGLPVILLDYLIVFIGWIYLKLLIKGWYHLYFTNTFGKSNEMWIKIRRQQYKGIRADNTNFNWYERFFMRQLDKKYNYGITKPFDHE